jgi:hypothetical protein
VHCEYTGECRLDLAPLLPEIATHISQISSAISSAWGPICRTRSNQADDDLCGLVITTAIDASAAHGTNASLLYTIIYFRSWELFGRAAIDAPTANPDPEQTPSHPYRFECL